MHLPHHLTTNRLHSFFEASSAGEGHLELSRTELRRRLCHMMPGIAAFLLAAYPHPHELSPVRVAAVCTIIVAGAFVVRRLYPAIARSGETHWTRNILKYTATIVALLILFPAHPEFAMVCITVVSFGDGSATLFGLLLGGPRLPWNAHKSWSGLIAFVACATPIATLAYWMEVRPALPIGIAFINALSAAGLGAVAESLPLETSDNLRVGLAAAAGVLLTHLALFGSFG